MVPDALLRLLKAALGVLVGYVAFLALTGITDLLCEWAVRAVFDVQDRLAHISLAGYAAPGVCLAGVAATYVGSLARRRSREIGIGFLAGAAVGLV